MPCDTRLKPRQTISERKAEVQKAVSAIEKLLLRRVAKPVVSPLGAIAFSGIPEDVRDGLTDACIYRRIIAGSSVIAKAEIARAEALAGRTVSRQVIGQGVHSHDGGSTWHDGH
jgi:hypothetical protein